MDWQFDAWHFEHIIVPLEIAIGSPKGPEFRMKEMNVDLELAENLYRCPMIHCIKWIWKLIWMDNI